MPRPADKIFLDLAIRQGAITRQDAADVMSELERLEDAGTPSKARLLCMELGFIDEGLAKSLKQEVRANLESREQQATQDSKLERRVAGFELLQRLGSGAMGVVFKARHLGLNKLVALKVLNPDFAEDPRYVERFLQEARVAAELNHPNIVQASDVGQQGDIHYIAMEYVDGKTVKELIERRGALDEQATIEITLQVVDALKHAHERSLIHRDIKPANIMITRDGQAKVLDLGLAKRTDVENGLTGEGRAIGTPYFMAPEQALDKGADYRADIYSLGATVFNMVTGEKPYVASTPVAVMNMHLKAPIPDAHEKRPEVSKGLAKIIAKMLAKRPADRYQDHASMIRDLEAVLGGLMPELDGGKPPEGMDFIAPTRTQTASRGQRQREVGTPAAEPASRANLIAIVAAVCLAIGGGLVVYARTRRPDVPRGPTGPVIVDDGGKAQREKEAADRLAGVGKPPPAGTSPDARRARAQELEAVGRAFDDTEAGKRARAEAQRLLAELADEDRGRADERRKELDGLAREGQLVAALRGYEELARTTTDAAAREPLEQRARDLRGELDDRVAKAEAEATRLAGEQQEAEAAAALRAVLPMCLDASKREALELRASRLLGEVRRREQEARDRQQAEARQAAVAEEQALTELPPRLKALVKEGRLAEARDAASALLDATRSEPLRQRAQLHVTALGAAAALPDLCREAFAKLVGGEVTLERRQGRPVEGKAVRVADGKLVVALSSRAEVLVDPGDLSEEELFRQVRRGLGPNHPPYLHGVAALKLYRDDADAPDALVKARGAGIDLSAVADELRPRGDATPVVGPTDPTPTPPIPDQRPDPNAGAVAEYEREKKIYENRNRLFPDAHDVGYADKQAILRYDYQANARSFGEHDWRLIAGRVFATPAGAIERAGLVLEGRNGRAEMVAPYENDFELELVFTSQMVGNNARLAITADDDDGRRVSCEFGQILYRTRRGQEVVGTAQRAQVRARALHRLMLVREGKKFITRFDGQQVTEYTVEEFGAFKLGVEWDRAALNLLIVEVKGTPTIAWVTKALE